MSGLIDSLTSASRSLAATQVGMDVAGQNIANVNTDGYSRRTVLLAEEVPGGPMDAGRGVTVLGIEAERDQYVESRLWTEQEGTAFDNAVVGGLTEVEAAVGLPGQSLDAQMSAFFDAFAALATDPTSAPARDGVVIQARQLTLAFHEMADRLSEVGQHADAGIQAALSEVNTLAAQVATLNGQISTGGANVESLRDQRNVAIARLSELVGATTITNSDGGIDLAIGSGHPLVVGTTAYPVTATAAPPDGLATISTGGFDVTGELSGGQIGGLLHLRDDIMPAYQSTLDQLAYDLASKVNELHTTGTDANGDPGGAFFTALAAPAGAAAALALDPAVDADSRLVAASSTGAIGNNDVARAIAALRDERLASGGTATPTDAWGQFAYRVGADLTAGRASANTHGQVMRQLQQLRAQMSGVSLDEEAANLMRFQRAYQANARYFTTIVNTLDTLLAMVN
jgi:flagellar hook-associated protein 1 FlgK